MVPVFLVATAFIVYGLIIDSEARGYVPLWLALAGALGGTGVCLKIVIAGRATRALEQNARDALTGRRLPRDGSREASTSGGSGGGAA